MTDHGIKWESGGGLVFKPCPARRVERRAGGLAVFETVEDRTAAMERLRELYGPRVYLTTYTDAQGPGLSWSEYCGVCRPRASRAPRPRRRPAWRPFTPRRGDSAYDLVNDPIREPRYA